MLRDGRVLLTGGDSPADGGPVLPAELFDPGDDDLLGHRIRRAS